MMLVKTFSRSHFVRGSIRIAQVKRYKPAGELSEIFALLDVSDPINSFPFTTFELSDFLGVSELPQYSGNTPMHLGYEAFTDDMIVEGPGCFHVFYEMEAFDTSESVLSMGGTVLIRRETEEHPYLIYETAIVTDRKMNNDGAPEYTIANDGGLYNVGGYHEGLGKVQVIAALTHIQTLQELVQHAAFSEEGERL